MYVKHRRLQVNRMDWTGMTIFCDECFWGDDGDGGKLKRCRRTGGEAEGENEMDSGRVKQISLYVRTALVAVCLFLSYARICLFLFAQYLLTCFPYHRRLLLLVFDLLDRPSSPFCLSTLVLFSYHVTYYLHYIFDKIMMPEH